MNRSFYLHACVLTFAATFALAQSGDSIAADEALVAQHIKSLADVSTAVRDAAASELRRIVAKYPSGTVNLREPDGGEARWKKAIALIKPGMTPAEVEGILGKLNHSGTIGSGQSHTTLYQLDYHWQVAIGYNNSPVTVISAKEPKRAAQQGGISLPAPADFVGRWIRWHANGEKGSEYDWSDGRVSGMTTMYYDNGQKAWQQLHNDAHKADGPGLGWHRDGSKMYSIQYRDDQRVGQWTHWYPNGKKRSEENLTDGKPDGPQLRWNENGQKISEQNYKNGIKDGLEAAWDATGRVLYQREYRNGVIVER